VEELRGRNALITGAAGGLGGYIARSLAGRKVNLALSDLPSSPLDELVEELRGHGVRVETVPADLTDREQLTELVERAEEAIGPLDVLVNNAGLEFGGNFLSTTPAELEAILDVNLLATMTLTRAALPGMQERGRGHVVNMASLAGKAAVPHLASYCATKHGVVGFTHALRHEYGSEPVGFSAICPGFISRVGMYGRLEEQVGEPPGIVGTLPPERVGDAVVRAITKNLPEVIVAKGPVRPLIFLNTFFPRAMTRLSRTRAATDFARRMSEARGRAFD
jgi:short-subunit dehydrogenase